MNVHPPALSARLTGRRADRIPGWVHAVIATVLLAVAVVAVTVGQPYQERVLRGGNDFLQLYSGAVLVGTNGLYSIEAVKRNQVERAGIWLHSVYYSRLPFYAALLRPLAWLPYTTAYWVFQSLNLVCCGLFAYVFLVRRHSGYLVWLPLFFPALIVFAYGQDVMIVLLFCALFIVLAGHGRDWLAGACLSLCLIKFHLFVFVPIAILAQRRWRVLLGGMAGSAFWLSLSFAVEGAGWPIDYLRLMRNPELHPGLDRMPTVFGVLRSFGLTTPAAALLVTALGVLFALALFKMKDFEASVGLALIAGIVLSVHAYVQDCTLLLIAIPLLAGRSLPSLSLRAVLLTPVPYVASLSGKPWNIVTPVALVAFSMVAVFDSFRRSQAVYRQSSGEAASPIGAETLGGA